MQPFAAFFRREAAGGIVLLSAALALVLAPAAVRGLLSPLGLGIGVGLVVGKPVLLRTAPTVPPAGTNQLPA